MDLRVIRELARALVVAIVGCRHARMYRERRTRFGANVWHFVCPDCGYVAPMLQRTEAETRHVDTGIGHGG